MMGITNQIKYIFYIWNISNSILLDNNEKLEAISKAMAYIPQSMTDDNFVRNCKLKVAASQKKNGKALVKIRKILGDNKYCETFENQSRTQNGTE